MDERTKLLVLCQRLTLEFPSLVFWKHLDRGLSGSGDIDAIAPPAVAELVLTHFSNHVENLFDDIGAIFSCCHADNIYPIFLLTTSAFPKLLQFDVSYQPVRFGLPWCDPAQLSKFSVINQEGIRVLQPGPLAVVLLMLYGFNRSGALRMKPHDWTDVKKGWVEDSGTALHFVVTVLPIVLHEPIINMLESLGSTGSQWNRGLAKHVWKVCLQSALRYSLSREWRHVWSLLQRRSTGLCDVQIVVHRHDRVVQTSDMAFFMRTVRATEHVLLDRLI